MLKWLIVLALILILFGGARKLPELARAFGRSVQAFRKGSEEAELGEEEVDQKVLSEPRPTAYKR